MMGLSVDKAGAARALAMAGARHWPAHLGERPSVGVVVDPELRSRLSAWAMATLALVGCEEAVNVDRAQVAALGMANGASLTGPGAFDPPRVGEDSGSGASGPIGGNVRDGKQARPVLSPESRPVLPEVLSWLRDRTFHGRVSREHAESLREALERRTAYGVKQYGIPLHSHTGRDVLHDLEEEIVDAIQYAMQAIDENGWEVNGFLHGILTAQLSAWCDYQRVRGVR
jgi:hypothetical protein